MTKGKVSDYQTLDARRLARMHGSSPSPSFVTNLADFWGSRNGRAEITMHADQVEVAVGDLVPLHWTISIARTQLGEGRGWRWWSSCPACSRTCAIIYFPRDAAPGCRACLDLRYPSQSQGRLVRAIAANHKVYARLKWNPAEPASWVKPPRMWHRTFLSRC